jgi:aspartate aminotransferase-like enzyme
MVNYLDKVSDLTSRNDAFYVVDSVSLLGGAPLPVDKWNIDVCMTGAQKAIAAPPGISPISVSAKAKKYMIENPPPTMYFNLARYFKFISIWQDTSNFMMEKNTLLLLLHYRYFMHIEKH